MYRRVADDIMLAHVTIAHDAKAKNIKVDKHATDSLDQQEAQQVALVNRRTHLRRSAGACLVTW